jgi:hypothetical protein
LAKENESDEKGSWEVSLMRIRSLLPSVAVALIAAIALAAPAAAAEVDLRARLQGSAAYTNASGHSEYDRSAEGRDLEVLVRNIGRLAGHRVAVFVSGVKVGTIVVTTGGVAHREWDTERGQSVPFASAGDFVKVRAPNGTLVASGKYVRDHSD